MQCNSELDVKEVLGIESWRNLSKDTFLRFLTAMPEIDKDQVGREVDRQHQQPQGGLTVGRVDCGLVWSQAS